MYSKYRHTGDFIAAMIIQTKQHEPTTNETKTVKPKPKLKSEQVQTAEVRIAEKMAVGQLPKCDSVARRISASPVFSKKIRKITVLWNKETRNLSLGLKQNWLVYLCVFDLQKLLNQLVLIYNCL
eukprot:m.178779 g.178779  ORF g.178779 m.178779 type:complete len:125 (+) comp39190_c0_seq26:192-566(+)